MGALWDYSSCTGGVYPIVQVVLAGVLPGLCVCELLFKLLKITLINNGGFGASALDNIIKALIAVLSSRRET